MPPQTGQHLDSSATDCWSQGATCRDHTVSRWSVRLGACGRMEKNVCALPRDSPRSTLTSLHLQCTHLWTEGGSWCFSRLSSSRKSWDRESIHCDTAMRQGAVGVCLHIGSELVESWSERQVRLSRPEMTSGAPEPGVHTPPGIPSSFDGLHITYNTGTDIPKCPLRLTPGGISPESVPVSLYWVEEKAHCVKRKTLSTLQVIPSCPPVCLCHFECEFLLLQIFIHTLYCLTIYFLSVSFGNEVVSQCGFILHASDYCWGAVSFHTFRTFSASSSRI